MYTVHYSSTSLWSFKSEIKILPQIWTVLNLIKIFIFALSEHSNLFNWKPDPASQNSLLCKPPPPLLYQLRPCRSKCQFPMTTERIFANAIPTELKVMMFVCSSKFLSVGFVFSLSSEFLAVPQETSLIQMLLFRFLFIFYAQVFSKVRGLNFRWEFHCWQIKGKTISRSRIPRFNSTNDRHLHWTR
jgi:hypothetical protein